VPSAMEKRRIVVCRARPESECSQKGL